MIEIDEAIGQVENLYRALTGRSMPRFGTTNTPMMEEIDASVQVKVEVERLIAALNALQTPGAPRSRPWMPPVSLFESTTDAVVCVDLPGVVRERVNVRVEDGLLVVEGERPFQPPRETDSPRVIAEQAFGPFRRTVLLPPGLKTSELNVQLKDGVLEVRIPRSIETGSKTTPVS